MIASRYINRF